MPNQRIKKILLTFFSGWIKSTDIFKKYRKVTQKKKKNYNKSYFVEYPVHCVDWRLVGIIGEAND